MLDLEHNMKKTTHCFLRSHDFKLWFICQINNLIPKKWHRPSNLELEINLSGHYTEILPNTLNLLLDTYHEQLHARPNEHLKLKSTNDQHAAL